MKEATISLRAPIRSLAPMGLILGIVAGGCSILRVQGPPKPGEADHDPAGVYPAGVPCTSGRHWPLVDAGLMLWVLAVTITYDNRDDRIDGALTAAAAAASAWIGYRRTEACREAQAAAAPFD